MNKIEGRKLQMKFRRSPAYLILYSTPPTQRPVIKRCYEYALQLEERLRSLAKYINHGLSCENNTGPCTCGLDHVLSELGFNPWEDLK